MTDLKTRIEQLKPINVRESEMVDIIRSLEAKVEEYKKREAVICKFMNGLGIEKINIPEGWFDGFGGCANENK